MSNITISVVQPPSTTINVGVDKTTLIQAGSSLPFHSLTHISGGADELNHNLLAGLQGGSSDQFFHINSNQHSNLVTGEVIRPSDTGNFYPISNPAGFITSNALAPFVTASAAGLSSVNLGSSIIADGGNF